MVSFQKILLHFIANYRHTNMKESKCLFLPQQQKPLNKRFVIER